MVWVPNPIYLMVGEWLLRNGVPIVARRLVKAPPSPALVLFEGEARLEHGPENIDGLLSVTTSHVIFTPTSIRTRGAASAIPLADVEEIEGVKGRFLGLIPLWNNGIKLRTRRGIFRFRVDPSDRGAWLRELRSAWAMAQRGEQPPARREAAISGPRSEKAGEKATEQATPE